MKKFCVSAVLTGVLSCVPFMADAAYPVHPGYVQNGQMAGSMYRSVGMPNQTYGRPQMVIPGGGQNVVGTQYRSVAAAQPTRVTGALPRVGSAQTTAGRQYYQPSDYDRLADSGLYVGLSAGYTASVMGGMSADYSGEQDASFVPGAFETADFGADSIIPLQISVGASINNDIRVDFSYSRYSGLGYPSSVQSSNGQGGFVTAQVEGGAITTNTTMLNIYYNIDSFTGYLAGGSLRPYIGAGVGMSLNSIADYAVYDNNFYAVVDDPLYAAPNELTGVSDIVAYHNGGTSEEFAFMLEGGVTTEMQGGIKLDFFVRYANLGKVKTSGSIVLSQVEWLGDGAGGEYQAPYDSVFHYTNWYESGRLGMVDVGVRLRLQF